jgi:hypothetical protein
MPQVWIEERRGHLDQVCGSQRSAWYGSRYPWVDALSRLHGRRIHSMRAVGVVGLLLELGGIGFALWGLDHLGKELFSIRSPLPHRVAGRWTLRRLGVKPPPNVIEATAVGNLGFAGSARTLTTKARPSDDDPLSEWNAYWNSRLEAMSKQIAWLKEDIKKGDNDLAERLSSEATERRKDVTALREHVRVIVAGEGGRGLVQAWWGFAMTLVGVVLQALA